MRGLIIYLLYAHNMNGSQRHFKGLSLSSKAIGSLPPYFEGRKSRRPLKNVSFKALQ
jgi:hypothetical protein